MVNFSTDQEYSYENLVQKLQEEGTLDEYYQYLKSRYGSAFNGDLWGYSMDYDEATAELSKEGYHFAKGFIDTSTNHFESADVGTICDGFLYPAMEKDLRRKPLETIFAVAEAERQFTRHPYLRAIDIIYKLNLPLEVDNRQEVYDKVKEFETSYTEGED